MRAHHAAFRHQTYSVQAQAAGVYARQGRQRYKGKGALLLLLLCPHIFDYAYPTRRRADGE